MLALSRWKIITVTLSVIFGLLFTLPNLLPQKTLDAMPAWLPHQKLNLGLDLQGGSYLLLEVDTEALRRERTTNVIEDVRNLLRDKQILFSDLGLAGGVVSVRITDPAQLDDAFSDLQKVGGVLRSGLREVTVAHRDDQHIELSFSDQALKETAAGAVDQSIEVIRKRIDSLGTKEPTIIRQGTDRIVVQAPGESDPERLKAVIGKTAKLSFQMVNEAVPLSVAAQGGLPPDSIILPNDEGDPPAYVLKKRAVVTGEMLTDASQGFEQQGGRPIVNFRFNGIGAARFSQATAENIGRHFAIVLDNRVISAPKINTAIPGGSGYIEGSFTVESARDLANLLKSGALPAPLKVQEQRTVGAELGADAVRAGTISLAIGAVAIVVFIVLAYGLFGVFAAIALIVNVLMMVGALNLSQATLTLPGIAGLILTLAVAVDANVLIYERMRDEARSGRTALNAAETGYRRALVSIIDANVTTMISALIMFQFGSGPVKGFAWTLSIGVLTSVFTAVVVTQLLIGWWFRITRAKTLPIG